MSLFKRLALTVKRITKTLDTTTGLYTSTTITRYINATIQPADAEMVEMMPEFDRAKKVIFIATGDLIAESEVLVYRGEDYRIIKVDDLTDMGLIQQAQYQAIGVRDV